MGCKTTVFYTGGIWHETDMQPWVTAYGRLGIEFAYVSPAGMERFSGPVRDRWVGVPSMVYEFVRDRHFDIIHFNDTLGEGRDVLAAKRMGLGFADTLLVLALHGPTRWAFGINRQPMDRIFHAAFDWAERVSVESADLLWGPSQYLIDAIGREGWALPDQVIRQQYVMPTPRLFDPDPAKFAAADMPPPPRFVERIAEIVFFGRLEERKGLRTFCAAIDRLGAKLAEAGIAVTFMGRPMHEDGESTEDWLRRASSSWPFSWRLETGFGQPEAIAYLTSRPLIAVMPSPFDNSPCTVYEAMQFGIPLLAAARGGIPELIDEADHGVALFEYTVDGLTEALERVVEHGAGVVRPRFLPAERRRLWRQMHLDWQRFLPAPVWPEEPASPASFVVMIDRAIDREPVLRSLASIRAALGDAAVKIVVLAARPLGLLPGEALVIDASLGHGLAPILHAAITDASADWVFCLSAGAAILPDAVALLTRALASNAAGAGIMPSARRSAGTGTTLVPGVGGAQAWGYYEGFGYTGAAILSRNVVMELLASTDELPRASFAGLADLVVTSGRRLTPFPEIAIELGPDAALAPVSFDPTRDRAFSAVEPLQASMIRWIGAYAYRPPPISRFDALTIFACGARWGPAAIGLYRFLHGVKLRLGSWMRFSPWGPRLLDVFPVWKFRRIAWYLRHPMSLIRLFDRVPGYGAGRRVYRALRGRVETGDQRS